jgi:signal transduction histidine kinase
VETENATLVTELERKVEADPERLKQLFENLVRNAVEHGSTSNRTGFGDAVENSNGSITVTVGELDGKDGFYVADDGPGIPEDERADVFETGYSTSEQGTGFGLRIVERIVEAHGWEIEVEESEYGGARFEISGVEML